MPGNLYALLAGIDDYEPPVRPLHGCINDLHEFESLLIERRKAAGGATADSDPP